MMPPHDVYIEMFLGSGAILRRKRPAAESLAYELNKKTIREFVKHLPAEHFVPTDDAADWNGVDDLPQCGGTSLCFHAPGDPYGPGNLEVFNVDAFDALKNKFVASSFFWMQNDPAATLIYADPPYPDDVRSTPGRIYEFELMAEAEHAELCDVLLSIPCKIMLSGYENELYNSKLKGWRKETIPTTNRAGHKVTETVWLNFPEPVELHDYEHVGDNFRDRWRFEKRLRNWTAQLIEMRPAERGAMIAKLGVAMDEFNAAGRAADAAATAKAMRRAKQFEAKLKPVQLATPKSTLPPAERPLFNETLCPTK